MKKVNEFVANEKEAEIMKAEVFGVNVAEVEEQVKHLVEVYKMGGKKATLKEWGHKLNDTLYGSDALVAKFLKVLFEAKNDEFIIRVLEEKGPTALWKSEVSKSFYAEDPSKWNLKLLELEIDLAESWAVYNLPILQKVMDALINGLDDHPAYLEDCYAVEDMLEDIKESGGLFEIPCFQSYVTTDIVNYLKDYDLECLPFLNDEGEVEDVDSDYLEDIWREFCDTSIIEEILLDKYCSFMVDAVREVLSRVNV